MKIDQVWKAGAIGAALLISAGQAQAGILTDFTSGGWQTFTMTQNDLTTLQSNEDGTVSPGGGGQQFDAEYFFYRQTGTTFEIGIQTGFDIHSNKEVHGSTDYWGGDIALNFDSIPSSPDADAFGWAIDFGELTKDINQDEVDADAGTGDGIDDLGLYQAVTWGGAVIASHDGSQPFAMDDGTLVADAIFADTMGSGTTSSGYGGTSYFRTFSIDLTKTGLDLSSDHSVYAHWTMSCGNDEMNGYATISSVPEPNTVAMITLGLMSIGFAAVRRRSIVVA